MAITDPLVLPPDVLLVPVAELPEAVRGRFPHDEGDVAITHTRSRVPSRVLEARAGELLAEFREPRTIVEAVVRFSRARGDDPERTLEEAYPLLSQLLGSGFLVTAGSPEAEGAGPWLRPGGEVGGFQILECLRGLEDSEVYAARRGPETAALKVERLPTERLERERAVLMFLDGDGVPRLLGQGEEEGRRWLALEWCPGVDAEAAAREARRAGRPRVLALCRAVAAAYARLHERGVIHGDVHPANLLVLRDGSVRLLDFGYARREGDPEPPRAGVPFFHEPEYAAALRQGGPAPAASPEGEQHAVGALLYRMASGAYSRDFSLEREAMLRQIAEEPPLPFADRGAEPWPELEAVLARALSKEPGDRFPSMAALAGALEVIEPPPEPSRDETSESVRLASRVIDSLAFDVTPAASVNDGAAGIACGLYRISLAREDPRLLAFADLWAEKAAAAGPGTDLPPETVGEVSPYHTATGIHAVRALIAHASGQPGRQAAAVGDFLAAARKPCAALDLTLGRCGLLLAGSLLLDPLPAGEVRDRLLAWGDEILKEIWDELDRLPPLGPEDGGNLGIAHGWAGFLYASLRWCRSAGRPLPARVPERLSELAGQARPWGRGIRWPWRDAGGERGSMAGWCNGSAGFVFLWTLAGDPDLAEGAAWNAWEGPEGDPSLCCGLAGRAYALLHLWKSGADPEWLARARDLAERAARRWDAETPPSLFKGALGAAVLAADLARPEDAVFPFFEEEGWAERK
ncbi:MAG: lanthionine synthetase LanC family protein [Thermoanaerobaculia bacterium]